MIDIRLRQILLIFTSIFSITVFAENKYKPLSATDGVSPNGKWCVYVENVMLENTNIHYARIRVINLSDNGLKTHVDPEDGIEFFNYWPRCKDVPNVILYLPGIYGPRRSPVPKIIWDIYSSKAYVYFQNSGIFVGSKVFIYNTANRSFKYEDYSNEKYLVMKKNVVPLPRLMGTYYVPEGGPEASVKMTFTHRESKSGENGNNFTIELENTSKKEQVIAGWDKIESQRNFSIYAVNSKSKKYWIYPQKKILSKYESELKLRPAEKNRFGLHVDETLSPGEYIFQIYLTKHPAIQSKWIKLRVDKDYRLHFYK